MNHVFNSEQITSQMIRPRARVILEFIEGDASRAPIVYAVSGGTDEDDQALCDEILKRWNRG